MLNHKNSIEPNLWSPFLVYFLVIGIEAMSIEMVLLYLKYREGIDLSRLLEIMQITTWI